MKTMNIEKQLQMDREVSSIEKLTVSEGLQYKKEEDGIRAIGPLYLIGSYSDAEGSPVMIRELIDMDVFAPAEKLSEEEFHIDIGEVQAQPQGHQIDVVIELQISGIKEEQEEGHAAQAVPQAQEEEAEDRALVQEDEEADVLSDTFEDLFEDDATPYTTCRLAVARAQDTYASIAARYHVDEAALRACNHERTLQEKTLVLLP